MSGGKKQKNSKKTRKLGIAAKLILPISVTMLGMCMIICILTYSSSKKNYIELARSNAKVAADVAVNSLDTDSLISVMQVGSSDFYYNKALYLLNQAKASCDALSYSILFVKNDDVVICMDTNSSGAGVVFGSSFTRYEDEVALALKGKNVVGEELIHTKNGRAIYSFAPIKDRSGKQIGVVFCEYNAEMVKTSLSQISSMMILTSFVALIIGQMILFFIIKNMKKSINQVDDKILELVHNGGDLTRKLEIQSGDEFELIGGHINQLLDYICNVMLQISRNSKNLDKASSGVLNEIIGAKDNISNVSATMEQMSAAMEETDASLQMVAQSISETYNAIENIAKSAEDGTNSSRAVEEEAALIRDRAVAKQDAAVERVKVLQDSIQKKIEKSNAVHKIDSLTEEILNITSQTNLLSLNANIEAARAGEAGRGFSVVASEIGQLANHSAEAATQIQAVSKEVISAVQELADEATTMIQFLDEVAMEGYHSLVETTQEYQKNVEALRLKMEAFAEESYSLEETMEEIKGSIDAISTAVEESTTGISDTSHKAVLLTDNIEDIAKQAGVNQEISKDLTDEVNKFILE